jgi:hypothetical protein
MNFAFLHDFANRFIVILQGAGHVNEYFIAIHLLSSKNRATQSKYLFRSFHASLPSFERILLTLNLTCKSQMSTV